MPDGHAVKQDSARAEFQAVSHLDIAVGWQENVEPAGGLQRFSPICGVTAINVRSSRHVSEPAGTDIPRPECLKVIDKIAKLGIKISIVMSDNPTAERNVIRISGETAQQTR
jgi:hypothetical protein